jgi:hypothetical protein
MAGIPAVDFLADAEGAIADVTGIISNAQGATNTFLETPTFYDTVVAKPRRLMSRMSSTISKYIGYATTFYGVIAASKILVDGGFEFILASGVFAITHVICLVQNMSNFTKCFFYYLIDIVFYICYLPIVIMLWVFKGAVGINLYPLERKIWDMLYNFDAFFYGAFGFHLIKWSKSVRDQCYNCKRLKTQVLTHSASKFAKDIWWVVPPILLRGVGSFAASVPSKLSSFFFL